MSLRISFDIGGVLSKYPRVFGAMVEALQAGGADVFVLTDMLDRQHSLDMLRKNAINVPDDHVVNCDYARLGERCKQREIDRLKIDLHIDDFTGYSDAAACSCVSLFVWPDPSLPYWADDWKTDPTVGDFGRRRPRTM
jgi:hypothetical protein